MISGMMYYNHANAYNDANQKATVSYWIAQLRPYVNLGYSLDEVKKVVKFPSLKNRKTAYESAYSQLLSEVQRTGGTFGSLGGNNSPVGNIGANQLSSSNNIMMYALIGVAVFLVFMIFKKK